jgi:hypothetical protein
MADQITVLDVKNALADENFRKNLPATLQDDVNKYMQNPNCSCNLKIYQKLMSEAKPQLQSFYPNKNLTDAPVEIKKNVNVNKFHVINCSIGELEQRMQALPPGRKQITISRWEDQVTVLINELETIS